MKYGYVRVSTNEQNEDRQIQAMIEAGVPDENIYVDKASGNSMKRPQWTHLLAHTVPGDVIVIKELDRLGRNLEQIKDTYDLLSKKNVYIKMLDNDLLSTEGKSDMELQLIQPMLIHLLGYMAEKEREKILQRQREGIDAMLVSSSGKKISKKTGRATGRPSKQESLSKEDERYIKAWIEKSIKLSDVKKFTGLSQATLYRIKDNWKKEGRI